MPKFALLPAKHTKTIKVFIVTIFYAPAQSAHVVGVMHCLRTCVKTANLQNHKMRKLQICKPGKVKLQIYKSAQYTEYAQYLQNSSSGQLSFSCACSPCARDPEGLMHRLQVTGCRLQVTDYKFQVIGLMLKNVSEIKNSTKLLNALTLKLIVLLLPEFTMATYSASAVSVGRSCSCH